MRFFRDEKGNVEMLPMVSYIFITVTFLYILVLAVAPVTNIVYDINDMTDPAKPYYYDIEPNFISSLKAWHVLLGLSVGIMIIRLFILAIKRQRYTGESEF